MLVTALPAPREGLGILIISDSAARVLAAQHAYGPDVLVIGLGYVGLPLAAEATRCGLTVTGYDPSGAVVSGLNAGRSHIPDVSSDDVAVMLTNKFQARADEVVRPLLERGSGLKAGRDFALAFSLQAHTAHDPEDIGRHARLLLDTRGVTAGGGRL
jgi:UDP-N-acetyl-D-mannosaminuronate dehydrogenase